MTEAENESGMGDGDVRVLRKLPSKMRIHDAVRPAAR